MKYMLHVFVLALDLCVRICGCAEKSHSNERAAHSVITNERHVHVQYGFSLLIKS